MEYLSLSEAAKALPRGLNGKKHSTNKLWRWARRGVKARDGRRIFLEHIRLGGSILVPKGAIEAFGKELMEADRQHFDGREEKAEQFAKSRGPKPPSSKDRVHAVRQAEESLEKDNI
jgi:hypothetical protein